MNDNHISRFIEAVNGGKGELDDWLECYNESDCRIAIVGSWGRLESDLAHQRELVRVLAEGWISFLQEVSTYKDVGVSERTADELIAWAESQIKARAEKGGA